MLLSYSLYVNISHMPKTKILCDITDTNENFRTDGLFTRSNDKNKPNLTMNVFKTTNTFFKINERHRSRMISQ